jgi:hypothetical protein
MMMYFPYVFLKQAAYENEEEGGWLALLPATRALCCKKLCFTES